MDFDATGRFGSEADDAPWHLLNFLPLPHGQGLLRPTFFIAKNLTDPAARRPVIPTQRFELPAPAFLLNQVANG